MKNLVQKSCRTIENTKVKESHNYDVHIIGYNQVKTRKQMKPLKKSNMNKGLYI